VTPWLRAGAIPPRHALPSGSRAGILLDFSSRSESPEQVESGSCRPERPNTFGSRSPGSWQRSIPTLPWLCQTRLGTDVEVGKVPLPRACRPAPGTACEWLRRSARATSRRPRRGPKVDSSGTLAGIAQLSAATSIETVRSATEPAEKDGRRDLLETRQTQKRRQVLSPLSACHVRPCAHLNMVEPGGIEPPSASHSRADLHA